MAETQGSITKAILWLAVSVVLIVTIILGMSVISNWFACDEAERATFAEFPQFNGWKVEPWGSAEYNACVVSYEAPDAPARIHAHFADQLVAHGWSIQPESTPEAGMTLLIARRGEYQYHVLLRSLDNGERSGWTRVEVRVNRGPDPTAVALRS